MMNPLSRLKLPLVGTTKTDRSKGGGYTVATDGHWEFDVYGE